MAVINRYVNAKLYSNKGTFCFVLPGRQYVTLLWDSLWGKTRAVFTHGSKGPGPRAENFQGRHIKKNDIEVWYTGKKRLSTRENFKGDLY
jgi:hypothetical protein